MPSLPPSPPSPSPLSPYSPDMPSPPPSPELPSPPPSPPSPEAPPSPPSPPSPPPSPESIVCIIPETGARADEACVQDCGRSCGDVCRALRVDNPFDDPSYCNNKGGEKQNSCTNAKDNGYKCCNCVPPETRSFLPPSPQLLLPIDPPSPPPSRQLLRDHICINPETGFAVAEACVQNCGSDCGDVCRALGVDNPTNSSSYCSAAGGEKQNSCTGAQDNGYKCCTCVPPELRSPPPSPQLQLLLPLDPASPPPPINILCTDPTTRRPVDEACVQDCGKSCGDVCGALGIPYLNSTSQCNNDSSRQVQNSCTNAKDSGYKCCFCRDLRSPPPPATRRF